MIGHILAMNVASFFKSNGTCCRQKAFNVYIHVQDVSWLRTSFKAFDVPCSYFLELQSLYALFCNVLWKQEYTTCPISLYLASIPILCRSHFFLFFCDIMCSTSIIGLHGIFHFFSWYFRWHSQPPDSSRFSFKSISFFF